MTEREQKLKEVERMSNKDKMEFYKKQFEIQVKIVFEVSKERNKLKKRVKELEELLKEKPERSEQLILFKNFFTYHNKANEGYKGIDDLFNEWYDNTWG